MIALALGGRVIPTRLLVAGVLASVLPDLDVIAFKLGIAYADQFGHRGASHSLVFAALLGMLAMVFAKPMRASNTAAAGFVFIAAISHGLLDMLTTGGLGVALGWPISHARLFFPVQVIQVSPLGLHTFFGVRGVTVLASELLWVWLPLTLFGVAGFLIRRTRARRARPEA